jgi:hypothetical protein
VLDRYEYVTSAYEKSGQCCADRLTYTNPTAFNISKDLITANYPGR